MRGWEERSGASELNGANEWSSSRDWSGASERSGASEWSGAREQSAASERSEGLSLSGASERSGVPSQSAASERSGARERRSIFIFPISCSSVNCHVLNIRSIIVLIFELSISFVCLSSSKSPNKALAAEGLLLVL